MKSMKKSITFIILVAFTQTMSAATKASQSDLWDWVLNNILLVVAGIVFVTAMFALWNTFETIIYNERRKVLAERGIELKPEVHVEKESIFKKAYDKAWDLIPMDKENEIDLKGEGLQGLGPNFTDQYWKHGGGIKNVFATIKHGVPEKGMIAWKNQMQASDIQKLASYILTLEGTNPPNQKAPEGELWVAAEGE